MLFLIILLGYLVNSAATLKESLFEDTVRESMADLSGRVANYEQYKKMERQYGNQGILNHLQNLGINDPNSNVEIKDTVIVQNGKKINQKIIYRTGPNGSYTSRVVVPADQDPSDAVNILSNDVVPSGGNLNSVIGDLFNLNMLKTLEERLPANVLDSLLRIELKEHGITAEYDFVVYDAMGNPAYLKNNETNSNLADLEDSEFNASLFPSDFLGHLIV